MDQSKHYLPLGWAIPPDTIPSNISSGGAIFDVARK